MFLQAVHFASACTHPPSTSLCPVRRITTGALPLYFVAQRESPDRQQVKPTTIMYKYAVLQIGFA